jgi:RNA polymerase sigma-70 factor, ECF subfamily
MDRDNQEWLTDLRTQGKKRQKALQDLRGILLRILPKALSRWLSPSSPHFDAFLEDVTQETLLRVLDRIESFEGRSKFTTWVYTIAIRIGLSELRLRKWQEVSLDGLEEGPYPDQMPFSRFEGTNPDPETALAQKNAVELVLKAIEQDLTAHQRAVMTAVVFQGLPLDVIAKRMDSNRNALYKVMHDARLKLKSNLEYKGYPPEELLKLFDQ